jgi:hypothetical protein
MTTRVASILRAVFLSMPLSVICSYSTPAVEAARIVEVEIEPHHRVVFENESVRILEVNIPAGTTTLYHRHRFDNVAVVLRNADASSQSLGESDADVGARRAGAVYFSEASGEGYVHRVKVGGSNAYHLIDVELTQSSSAEPLAENAATKASFDNGRIRVFTVKLEPGGSSPSLTLRSGVLVVLPGATVEQIGPDGNSERIISDVRPWRWRKPGTWTLRNVSSEPAVAVEIEIK